IVGEPHAFRRQLVEVRRPAGHDALVVDADIGPADVVTHDEDDIGPLLLRGRWRADDRHGGKCRQHTEPDRSGPHGQPPPVADWVQLGSGRRLESPVHAHVDAPRRAASPSWYSHSWEGVHIVLWGNTSAPKGRRRPAQLDQGAMLSWRSRCEDPGM